MDAKPPGRFFGCSFIYVNSEGLVPQPSPVIVLRRTGNSNCKGGFNSQLSAVSYELSAKATATHPFR